MCVEAHSVIKSDSVAVVINVTPLSIDALTVTLIRPRALDRCGLVVVAQSHTINVLFRITKAKLHLRIDNLALVRKLMSADLFDLE